MSKPILFSLEKCIKCTAVKDYLKEIDYDTVIFPHSYKDWSEEQIEEAKKYGIFEELKIVAPILVIPDSKDAIVIGQLRIKKWVQDGNK